MKPDFHRLMQEATRLTRAGDPVAATAVIQAAIGGGPLAPEPPPAAEGGAVIDVELREVRDTRVPDVELRRVRDLPVPEVAFRESRDARIPSADAPGRAAFVAGSHEGPAGRRDYKLFIPPEAGMRAMPLIVMLHGCTQDPDDFAIGTSMNDLATAHGFFVLYPAQSQRIHPQRCWNWFKHTHQRRGSGEPSLLAGMTRETLGRHRIDPERVYVAGLSAGGAMAAILGKTYPDLYAAVGVHSGIAAGIASDLPSALSAMKGVGLAGPQMGNGMPTIVFHGDADGKVHPRNGEIVVAASVGSAQAFETETRQLPAGRAYTRRLHRGPDGSTLAEHWIVHGAPHAWSGGSARGSHTDVRGPDASAEMLRFFLEHPRRPTH